MYSCCFENEKKKEIVLLYICTLILPLIAFNERNTVYSELIRAIFSLMGVGGIQVRKKMVAVHFITIPNTANGHIESHFL